MVALWLRCRTRDGEVEASNPAGARVLEQATLASYSSG